MCGRARLSSDWSELKIRFRIPDDVPAPNYPARWNLAPTQSIPIIHHDTEAGHRVAPLMRWGLIPFWAKDAKIGYTTINARSDTIDTKPAFREAFKRRRCLVPIDSFYEWEQITPKVKQPWAIALKSRTIMGMAGLWETWKSPEGEVVKSFTIATSEPNTLMAGFHDRMPVILDEQDWPTWLGEAPADPDALKQLLRPYPDELMDAWKVGAAVGNVRNEGPSLLGPLAV